MGIFAIVCFGLSIDYEVFFMSRLIEGRALTGDDRRAIDYGLRKTAGVTGAAFIMAAVFLAFAASPVANTRQFGVGTTVAVLLDATVVRPCCCPRSSSCSASAGAALAAAAATGGRRAGVAPTPGRADAHDSASGRRARSPSKGLRGPRATSSARASGAAPRAGASGRRQPVRSHHACAIGVEASRPCVARSPDD